MSLRRDPGRWGAPGGGAGRASLHDLQPGPSNRVAVGLRWGRSAGDRAAIGPAPPLQSPENDEAPRRRGASVLHSTGQFPDPCLGANDGARTRDRLDHNQELYQLSYVRQAKVRLQGTGLRWPPGPENAGHSG